MMKPTTIPLKHFLLRLTSISLFLDFFFILRLKWNEWYNTCIHIYISLLLYSSDDGSSFYIIYALVMPHIEKIKTLFFLLLFPLRSAPCLVLTLMLYITNNHILEPDSDGGHVHHTCMWRKKCAMKKVFCCCCLYTRGTELVATVVATFADIKP